MPQRCQIDCNQLIFALISASIGKDKLGVPASEPVRLVLESDGTQVEDGEYFRTLANNTILLLLRQGERWYPTGVDVIKAGL
jgi:CIDE-N domain